MARRILVVDNRDSFTYNLVHYLEKLECSVEVLRADTMSPSRVPARDAVVISPGPGLPTDWPNMLRFLVQLKDTPTLGVCLGMQAMNVISGGTLQQLDLVRHGIQRPIRVDVSSSLFHGLAPVIPVGLYHSWAVDRIPEFHPLAWDSEDVVMAMEHKEYPWQAVQFHPESIMTDDGMSILGNFISEFLS